MTNSLRPHESQHTRPPCPSPNPGVHSDLHPSSQWCHPAISSSVVPFSSCPQSLPASESFPVSQLFAWGGQSTRSLIKIQWMTKYLVSQPPLTSMGTWPRPCLLEVLSPELWLLGNDFLHSGTSWSIRASYCQCPGATGLVPVSRLCAAPLCWHCKLQWLLFSLDHIWNRLLGEVLGCVASKPGL